MSTAEELIKTYENELNQFQEWIDKNPRLPKKNFDKLFLLRHLKVYDFDLEQAKKLLILNLESRKKHSYIFHNRDFNSDAFQTALSTMQCMALPYNTKENHKISIFRLTDPDPNKFSYVDIVRMLLVLMDLRLILCDPNELIDGEVGIIDVSGFGFRHFTKIIGHLSTFKAYSSYAQEAAPIKIIQNHFINCSPIMEKLLGIMKPFLKKEVVESIKIHSSFDTLYEYVPRDHLPTELGGTKYSITDIYPIVKQLIDDKRDYLTNDENWKIND